MSCPHGLNHNACLQCFHAPKPKQEAALKATAKAPLNPIVAAVKQRSAQQPQMAMEGVRPDGEPAARPEPTSMPKPVYANPPKASVPGAQGQPHANVVAPFSYANDPGRFDGKGLWHPPKHRSVIDSKPRHPNAEGKR